MLKELRNTPSTTYLGSHTLNYGSQPSQNIDHICNYSMQANTLLSSVVTHDEDMPLLFRDKTNDNIENIQPFTQA